MGQVIGTAGSVNNAIQSVTNLSSRHLSVGRLLHKLSKQHKECVQTGKKFEPDTKLLWSEANGLQRYRHTGLCMMPHVADQSVLHVRPRADCYERGDVVVLQNASNDGPGSTTPSYLLRRIAAVPGDILARRPRPDEDENSEGEQTEIMLEDNMVWVTKDNSETEGHDSSDFGPLTKDAILGCAVRIGDKGEVTVHNSTQTLEAENNLTWISLTEIEDVVKGFQSYASSNTPTTASMSTDAEQALKDSIGFFKLHEEKMAEKEKTKEEKSSPLDTSTTTTMEQEEPNKKTSPGEGSADAATCEGPRGDKPPPSSAPTKQKTNDKN